jgi:hypothetical protein
MYRWKPAPRSSPSNHETGALETVDVDLKIRAAALGVRPRGISKSEVSRICAGLDEDAGRPSGSTLSTT